MVPVEVGVAEVGGMDGGDVGLHSAVRNHCAHGFPASSSFCYVKCVFILAVVLSA